jgi:hypothetical protein
LPLTRWEAYSEDLSEALGVADWYAVSEAYGAIKDLNRLLDQRDQLLRPSVVEADPASGCNCVEPEDGLEWCWRTVRNASWVLRDELGEGEKAQYILEQDQRLAEALWPKSI